MDIPTIPGAVYTISSASSCDVTDKASGQLLGTASSGSPFTTPAYSDALTLSDPDALYVQIKTFNFALAALGLLGGGSSTGGGSTLPAGFLAAEFLESTGEQYVDTEEPFADDVGISCSFSTRSAKTEFYSGAFNTASDRLVYPPMAAGGSRYATYAWGLWTQFVAIATQIDKIQKSNINWLNSKKYNWSCEWNGGNISGDLEDSQLSSVVGFNIYLFRLNSMPAARPWAWPGRLYNASISKSEKIKCNYLPCLNSAGIPSLYDNVGRKTFTNKGSGQFIIGFTLPQARQLGKLPATGGTLTVSLPTGYEADEGVTTALETARSNGWTLTVQTYEAETAAATFALRRIWVRRTQAARAPYVDADGTSWHVDWCVDMLTPDGSTPDAHGYELFRSVDTAVEYWGLAPYVDPESENLLT